MSTDATSWAWKQRTLSPTQKLVLLTMADRANEEHRCWPSNARMQADTGLDRKTIYNCIADMEAMGILRVYKRSGVRNVYELVGVLGREDGIGTSAETGTSAENNTSPKNGQQPVPKTDYDQSQKRDTESKRESKNNLTGRERAQAHATPTLSGEKLPSGQNPKRKRTPRSREPRAAQEQKQQYGEFGNVKLSQAEYQRLVADKGQQDTDAAIEILDLHLGARKGADPYKSHALALRKWVFDELADRQRKQARYGGAGSAKQNVPNFDDLVAAKYGQAGGEL